MVGQLYHHHGPRLLFFCPPTSALASILKDSAWSRMAARAPAIVTWITGRWKCRKAKRGSSWLCQFPLNIPPTSATQEFLSSHWLEHGLWLQEKPSIFYAREQYDQLKIKVRSLQRGKEEWKLGKVKSGFCHKFNLHHRLTHIY